MKKIIVTGFLLFFCYSCIAQLNLNNNSIALHEYDVVSYYSNKPVKGNGKFMVKFKTGTYYFSSEMNKKLFIANPNKYLPNYGGYCAYAMGADGSLVDIDPETYEIIDGKLYLFYNKFFNNTKEKWDLDKTNLKKNADFNWNKLYKK